MSSSPTPMMAQSAETFDQSIGVNVHMGYNWTPYANVALVESDLAYLGVINVRDKPINWSTLQGNYEQLAAAGIKFDFVLPVASSLPVNLSQFVSTVDSFAQAYPGSVSAIEGPNEVNFIPANYAGGTSYADQAALQKALYAAVRADPNLNGIPVYNLTLGSTDASLFSQLGNLSSAADYANEHGYLADWTTPGAGLGLKYLLPFAQIDAPGLPEVITETGYETNPADTYSGVDQMVQAKLTLDTLMDAFKAGVSETYLYELIDEGGQNFGLFNSDGTPKLAATAIHNLTTILADPGSTSTFTPGSLSYAVPDLPASGNQLLLEKSNGTFDLVLWAEAQIWNPNTESEIVAPTETSTVNFGQAQKLVLVFDPLQGTTPIAVYSNVQSIQIQLTDHPIIIELPSAAPTLATPKINGFSTSSNGGGTLTGTAEANSTVVVYDGTTQLGTAIVNASGAWGFITGTLQGGTHSFTALDTDAAGDISQTSAALAVTIGTQAPAAPVIANDIVNGNSVTLSGTAAANSTVTVYDGQTALGTTTVNASGAWSYTTGALANGNQTFTATATDAAGNASTASNAVDPTIALTGLQAGTLLVANGTTLYITGTVNNTGTIAPNATGNGAELIVIGNATLTGSGKLTLSNNVGNVVVSNGAPATLTNVNNVISGAGTIGDSQLTLINQGIVNANNTVPLVINTRSNTINNSGTLEASSIGGLDIVSNVNNSKTIEALGTNAKVVIAGLITNTATGLVAASGSGAQVDLCNATISGGTLQTVGRSAFIETVSDSANVLAGGTISSGSVVEVNSGSTLSINGAVANSGTILVNGGTLDLNGTLSGGTIQINGPGRVVIATTGSENVAFQTRSAGQLVLDQASSYSGEIFGFGTTQSIDLANLDFAAGVKFSYASSNRRNTIGVLTVTDGTTTSHLQLQGTYTLANFKVASDGNGGTLVTDPTVVMQNSGKAAATIGNNTVLEVNIPDSGNVTFSGTTGSLWLDQPATFAGKVSGLGAQNVIDLPGIAFSAQTTLGYSPNSNKTGGTLSLTDGVHSAKIALLGSYMASSFVMESDNHGGTMVLADVAQSANQPLLTHPQHP